MPLKAMSWDIDFFLLRGGNDAITRRRRRERVALVVIYLGVFVSSRLWLGQVTKHVPEPYLDEVFHIPQAQAYCRGDFHVWDPKLTTPPGLYIISTLMIKYVMAGTCTVYELRIINCLALSALFFASYSCRSHIKSRNNIKHGEAKDVNWDAVHMAVNICLFPPLFFFSGLYYTDVVSTIVVMGAYRHFLRGGERTTTSTFRSFGTYAWGISAVFMRQTNIFWVAILLAGLETARAFKKGKVSPWPGMGGQERKLQLEESITQYAHGELHDPPLRDASVLDFLWCSISIAVAVICHPLLLIMRLWPYLALLTSFGGFILWNGGVVLGDKSNHIAAIHLPQMLYIWPFFTFFSFPLIYPYILLLLSYFIRPHVPRSRASNLGERPVPDVVQRQAYSASVLLLPLLLVLITVIIHFNTIIHPFILADNRHYVFYVFRYTIRRYRLAKYALAPIYIFCSWFTFRCLGGLHSRAAAVPTKAASPTSILVGPKPKALLERDTPEVETSFAVMWVLSTALSLVTAPLVEPRYFIVPWVIWRLHLPAIPSNLASTFPSRQPRSSWSKYWAYSGHDLRLWVETLWFLVINVTTGYIFLFRVFEWPQEPGRLQRFMW